MSDVCQKEKEVREWKQLRDTILVTIGLENDDITLKRRTRKIVSQQNVPVCFVAPTCLLAVTQMSVVPVWQTPARPDQTG